MRLSGLRFVGFLAVLLLVLGTAMQGASASSIGGHLELKAETGYAGLADCQAAGESSSPGMEAGACYALCAGIAALPVSISASVELGSGTGAAAAEAGGHGRFGPPDPYPPRTLFLS